jgi:hypothetical protein
MDKDGYHDYDTTKKVVEYEALIRDLTDALRGVKHERDEVIEEIALEIERFTFAFGVDTVQSFAAFVRGMK